MYRKKHFSSRHFFFWEGGWVTQTGLCLQFIKPAFHSPVPRYIEYFECEQIPFMQQMLVNFRKLQHVPIQRAFLF